jgi:hypothetical protein
MKNFVLFFFLFLASIIILPSCQKEETVIISDTNRIEQTREILSKYELPSIQKVMDMYLQKKSGGLKDATIIPDAKIGLTNPVNDLYTLPNGDGFKQVWVWIMVDNFGSTVDKGLFVIYYDNKLQEIRSWDFLIGWENEYCIPVLARTNVKNVQIRMNFSFPVKGGGNLSYETFSDCQKEFEVWLPAMQYDFRWETIGGATFAGLKSFNSSTQTGLDITIGNGIDVNTFDYIVFNLNNVEQNSSLEVNIMDESGNYLDKAVVDFPFGKKIPTQIMIPLSFKPYSVMYRTITYPKGIQKYGD